jgi:hypothetical protein
MGFVGGVHKVTAPDGTEWELSISYFVPPSWQAGGDAPMVWGRFGYGEGPLSAIWEGMIVPLFRLLFTLPFAVAKGRRSGVVWIAAKSYYPELESYYWTTTSKERAERAVVEIARGIARGEHVPRPLTATYHGTTQD